MWHTNVLLATNLTVLHIAVSIVSTIVLVEGLFPEHRQQPSVSRRSLLVAAVALLALPPGLYGEYTLDPLPQLVAAATLMGFLVVVALRLPGRPRAVAADRTPTAMTDEARPLNVCSAGRSGSHRAR